jgi:hypothetical protein
MLNKIKENFTDDFRVMSTKETIGGTAHTFLTTPPAWARRVTIFFDDVSGSGTSDFLIQLSAAASFSVTGYDAAAFRVASGGNPTIVTSTAGFILTQNNLAASLTRGSLVIERGTDNEWYVVSGTRLGAANTSYFSSGVKKLGGILDGIRITTVNGTDTFDNGSITYTYEA